MRVKTSVTLPADLIAQLDRLNKNRSAVLEQAARAFLAMRDREVRDAKDAAIIERHAGRLNREAEDVLGFQRLR